MLVKRGTKTKTCGGCTQQCEQQCEQPWLHPQHVSSSHPGTFAESNLMDQGPSLAEGQGKDDGPSEAGVSLSSLLG